MDRRPVRIAVALLSLGSATLTAQLHTALQRCYDDAERLAR